MEPRGAKKSDELLGGILLTTIGSGLLMANLGFLDMGEIWRYWPAILIAVGVAKLIEADGSGRS